MQRGTGIIHNIGPGERRKRWRLGGILLGLSLAGCGMLLALGSPRWWRGLLVLPLWGSMLGFFQARAHT